MLLLLLRCRGQRQRRPALLLLLHRGWVGENEPLEAAPIAICSNGFGRASNIQSNFEHVQLMQGTHVMMNQQQQCSSRSPCSTPLQLPYATWAHPCKDPRFQPTLAAAGRAQQQPSVVEAGAKQAGAQLANAQVGAWLHERQLGGWGGLLSHCGRRKNGTQEAAK